MDEGNEIFECFENMFESNQFLNIQRFVKEKISPFQYRLILNYLGTTITIEGIIHHKIYNPS